MSLFNLPAVKKIQQSNADAWVFALYAFSKKIIHCVIIEPAELMRRIEKLSHPKFYLWVTADEKHCFATRGLKKGEEQQIAAGDFSTIAGTPRDFSSFLENWTPVNRRIKPSSAR
jgi:hypothetical protein